MIFSRIIDEQWKAQVHLLCEHGIVVLNMQRVLEPHNQSPDRFTICDLCQFDWARSEHIQ